VKRILIALFAAIVALSGLMVFVFRAWHLGQDDTVIVRFSKDSSPPHSDLGLLLREGDYSLQTCCKYSTTVVDGVGGARDAARKFEVRTTDTMVRGSFRSELRFRPNYLHSEFWYQSRIFVPADWVASDAPVVAMQWHNTRDFFLGESGNIPPLSLNIVRGEWLVGRAWDKRWISPETPPRVEGQDVAARAPIEPGKWTEWTFHVRWSPGNDGFLKVWKDGRLLADQPGPIGHQDLIGPYLKAGVYVPAWKDKGLEAGITSRRLYFDLIVATADAAKLPLAFDRE
jgi:hypothetical protein